MSPLLSKLTNFNAFKLPGLPQLRVDRVCCLVEEPPNSGELKLRDKGIPPDEGMFVVLWLNRIRVLVQHVDKLQYRPTANLKGISYAIVRPVPTLSDTTVGCWFTVVAEGSHFLVQIVKLLPPIDDLISKESGMGSTVVPPPASPITNLSGMPPAITPNLTLYPTRNTSGEHQTTTQNALSLPTSLPGPECSSSIRPKPRNPNRRVKPPPIPPINVAIMQEITTTVDPIPSSNHEKSLPSVPVEDEEAQYHAPSPIGTYHSLPQTALHVGGSDNRLPSNPQSCPHSVYPVQGQHTRSLSESGIPKPSARNTVSHGRTSSMSRPQRPQLHRSTPLGESPLRNEIMPLSPPDSPPEVALSPTRPAEIEGLNLRNFPSRLTPSPVEDIEDEFNAQREAIVGVKFPSPSFPAARRTSGVQGTKPSKHSRSRSLVAVHSTTTPNPRTHVPLPDHESPSYNNSTQKNRPERHSNLSPVVSAGSLSGSSRRPLGLGLDLSGGQSRRLDTTQGRGPPSPTPGTSSSPIPPSPAGNYSRHHRRAGSLTEGQIHGLRR